MHKNYQPMGIIDIAQTQRLSRQWRIESSQRNSGQYGDKQSVLSKHSESYTTIIRDIMR